MNQNTFCSKCHRVPSQCCCSSALTDEEINQVVWQQNLLLGNDDLRKFARAILKKASEK